MKRIHIPNMGPNEGNVTTAIAAAMKECREISATEVTLITPLKNNLDMLVVGHVLREAASKQLMKGLPVTIGDHGINLIHHSTSTVAKTRTPKVGLAFYLSTGDIKKLDALTFEVLLYVPWLDTDGVAWAAKWAAQTLDGGTPGQEIDLPAEVIAALERLTRRVNLSTGLGHPSDKDAARSTFSNLKASGIRWKPSEVEKWAARNRWRPADAEELAKLSARHAR
jgi:hypothetical protein